jgi:Skp family chaperone for outer membrane proteins
MKATVFLAIASLVPSVFLMQASGGPSVAVIDFERVVSEAPGGKDALDRLNTFRNEQLAALSKKQQEANDLANKIRTQDRALSEAARTQLTRDLEATQTSLQTMADDAQQKLGQMQQQLLGPVEQKTSMAVSAYAQEHSVKIVFDAAALQNGLVYVHDTADITTEVIRRMATNLENHRDLDASTKFDKFLSKPWFKLSLRPEQSN